MYKILAGIIIVGWLATFAFWLRGVFRRERLWVDDVRPAPRGWKPTRTFHEAIQLLETGFYREVSLDHDLCCYYGNKEMTGRDILNWLIERKLKSGDVPDIVNVHSANPVGRATMEADIKHHWETT